MHDGARRRPLVHDLPLNLRAGRRSQSIEDHGPLPSRREGSFSFEILVNM